MAVSGATSETAAYTAQVAAWSIAANNATGETDTHIFELEKQKAAEEEANKKGCQIASMCVEPEEGPGEETFGDPVHCYVGGKTVVEGDQASVFGDGGCNEGLPMGTWIYACVGALSDLGPQTEAGCNHVTVKHHRSRYWAIAQSKLIHCESGEIVRALVEFYVPGGKVLYAGTENGGECDAASDEVDEAALTLFYSPDDPSGVLELLLAFFRNAK
jgi:hypothetical protein